jgi:AmmeMemoRadiSam system protein B
MRYPAVAGRFYPLGREDLISEIEACFTHRLGPGMPSSKGSGRRIVAAVCPHAGYMASGMNAAHVYRHIAEDGLPEAYVIIGPDHHGVPFDAVMCSEEYLTPMGSCKIHREIAERLRGLIPDNCLAHRFEHSVEVQIPFLQYIDPDSHIIPVIMGDQEKGSAEKLAAAIKRSCEGHDVVVIASSDMSHYVPKEVGEKLNHMVLNKLKERDIDGMYSVIHRNKISVCGYGPMATAMLATSPSEVSVLKYSDSWDSLGHDRDSVVGYGSLLMYK